MKTPQCMYCGANRDGPHFANCPTQKGAIKSGASMLEFVQ